MVARLTFIRTSLSNAEQVIKIYNEEIVPVVRTQRGNVGCWLLEPTNEEDEFISLTEWTSAAEADSYEASGTYQKLVETVKELYTSKPILRTYNVAGNKISFTATQ